MKWYIRAVGDRRSLLVVSAAPDRRTSSTALRNLVLALDERADVQVSIWYLRDGDGERADGARIVDELRQWAPSKALERVGLGRLAGVLRGRRLRSWYRDVDPDAVLLDDGIGLRVVPRGANPKVVVRENDQPPADSAMEPILVAVDQADIVIAARPRRGDRGNTVVVAGDLTNHLDSDRRSKVAATRSALRLNEGALVAGWAGQDEHRDLERFMRVIRELDAGQPVAGVWFARVEPASTAGFIRLADSHGLGDRVSLRSDSFRWSAASAADAVLLPEGESQLDGRHGELAVDGVRIVAVDDQLDSESSAGADAALGVALAAALAEDRDDASAGAVRSFTADGAADELCAVWNRVSAGAT